MGDAKEYMVSIVTAVYNVEDYLAEMIDSIIRQSIGFENIQLILVDDGSKDNSGEICEEYALQYPENIVVIHKENGGVSSARNEGLKHVKGKYINFTDADDKLYGNALEKMYSYLDENKEWIDLVSIPLKFFGAKRGEHPLNYKYKKTRIIDLRQEYECIQLAVNSILVKKECFNNRCFDTELSYAEDAKIAIDILLDKMRYGAVCGTAYLYRKRASGGSAIDSGTNKYTYYIPTVERFTLHSLENAKIRKGYIPQFVQFSCMYDMQWRLKKNPFVSPGVLTKEDEEKYKSLLLKAIQYIDNKVLMEQKIIGNNYKISLLSLKENNLGKKELVVCPNDMKLCIEDISSAYASSYTMVYEFIDILPDKILIEGHIRYFVELDNIQVILKTTEEETAVVEYTAELFERKEKRTYCMDEIITNATGFKFSINLKELPENVKLGIYLRYQGNDIEWHSISFGKFFPLSKQLKRSYLYEAGILLTYSENMLNLLKVEDLKVIRQCERKFQKEMLFKKDKKIVRGWLARNINNILKKFKRKELWLISDRLTKADDNGEAFFTYMNCVEKNPAIDTYFVLDKSSEDYERLCKIGKVVSFHSTKHKILSLLCDKIISSQGEDYVFNRFYNMSYLYKDIQHQQKFIFLQHGIIQNDLSGWLEKTNKNINLFVTTTNMEYQSILDYAYYYDEKQVKCTGLPRYDYLYDDTKSQNIITFMPTWRAYLASNGDARTDSRVLYDGFEDSTYYKMYQEVFSNAELGKAIKKYNYKINLMIHPTMPRECVKYFECFENINILDRSTRYRELFSYSKLVVTDYSSAVFDFAYLRKPVLYYQQDIAEFYSGKHTVKEGYFNYERDGFGEVEYTAEALVNRIIEYMENGCQLKDSYRDRIEKTFPYNDKGNCKRVYNEIIKL